MRILHPRSRQMAAFSSVANPGPVSVQNSAASAIALVAALALSAPATAVDYPGFLWQGGGIHVHYLWNVPGLSTLDFSFPGQRTVRSIAAMPDAPYYDGWETMRVSFLDDALSDSFGTTFWANLPSFTFADSATTTSSSACGGAGSCRIPIEKQLDGEVFVLSGFSFRFLDDDHYIAEMAVRPNPLSGYVDVTFTDASRNRPFSAAIAYAYYPAERVTRVGNSFKNAGSAGSYYSPGARKVLQGFRVAYDSGDHPIQRFTIDLAAGIRIRLVDADGAEPINWSVDWLELAE